MDVLGFNPADLGTAVDMILDPSMARPIKIFVDRKKGQIWRLVDPMSPTEKMPVVKEWTETEKTFWETDPKYEDRERKKKGKKKKVKLGSLCHTVEGSAFKFDKPGRKEPESAYMSAFASQSEITEIQQRVNEALGEALPSGIQHAFLLFGHADMTNTFVYNHSLTGRRNRAVQLAMGPAGQTKQLRNGRVNGSIPCSDFNPTEGPSDHELAAETSSDGVASRPAGASETGNVTNRRTELFVLHDYADPSKSEVKKLLSNIRAELIQSGRVSTGDWPTDGTFPCTPGSVDICRKLSNERRNRTADGQDWRFCEFYKRFTERLPCIELEGEGPGEDRPIVEHVKVKDAESGYTEKLIGEYHPPAGEHYHFFMRKMVETGVLCAPALAPEVAVAPNRKEDTEDFNLIKAGPIKVVKMDIGFWGDARTSDSSRKAGFYRSPKRYFGAIEGPFVWLCYFQTADTAVEADGQAAEVDEKINPLFAKFVKAATEAGHTVRVVKKAVAEDGPDASKLILLFPDMHLPRKLEEKDAEYSADKCVYRYHMVKSMVLSQLRRDYNLRADQTPWLSIDDRIKCRDFFEHGGDKLKLAHYSSGRKMSNPFDPEGEGFLEQAGDAAMKAFQALQQIGYYMFAFSREDLLREVKEYPKSFPEAGRGRTHDALCNWFYGFETDRNQFPAGTKNPNDETTAEDFIPGVVKDVADSWGANLNPSSGSKPAQESYDRIDPGPARDLLRLLKVVEEQNKADRYIRVIQTGDIYELWANRRFLFEDFAIADDPLGVPETVSGLEPSASGGDSFKDKAIAVGKAIGAGLLRTLLAGMNSSNEDVWYRKECKKRLPTGQLPEEKSYTGRMPDYQLPRFGPGLSVTAKVELPYTETTRNETREKVMGAGYVSDETSKRTEQVLAFEAPIASGGEDAGLLKSVNVRGDMGLWNKGIADAFGRVGAKFIYGNHDCYRGLHGGSVKPYLSEENLWIEHGHRFEDSNIDGQPFGAFVTNFCYDVMELALYESVLDEFTLHREQSQYQPGMLQWFLLTEFGLDSLDEFGKAVERGAQAVKRFRICVSGHTHVPDLVNAEIIFRQREDTMLEGLITDLGAAVKAILLMKKLYEWLEKWTERNGWEKLWEDIKGNTLNWGVDFAGLAQCTDRAIDFLKKQGQDAAKKLEDEWNKSVQSGKDKIKEVKDGLDRLGL